jgi:hypothetical protein
MDQAGQVYGFAILSFVFMISRLSILVLDTLAPAPDLTAEHSNLDKDKPFARASVPAWVSA